MEGNRPIGGGEPARPRIEARREGDLAVVSYRFEDPAAGEGGPARFVAAAVAYDNDPSETHSLAIDGRKGSFAMRLPSGRDWAGVRVSVASDRGVAGATVAAAIE
jgi:hypothetical protein